MKKFLIANVGNSDVQIDGQFLKFPMQDAGPVINSIEEYKGRITFPLITPLFEKYKFDGLFLFASLQDDSVPEELRRKDTYLLAQIIKLFFPHTSIYLVNGNPSDYSGMYIYYAETLSKIKTNIKEEFITYLSLTGGTQAQNTSLLIQGIKSFGLKADTVYISPDKGPETIGISRMLFRDRALGDALLAIRAFDYPSAMEILQAIGIDRNTMNFIKYLNSRKNFDFKRASESLESIESRGDEKIFIEKLIKDLKVLEEGSDRLKLKELYNHIDISWKMSKFMEFLAFMFRFHESYLFYLLERELGIKITGSKGDINPGYIEFVNRCEVREFLSKQRAGKNTLKFDSPSRPVLMAIIRYLIEKEGKAELRKEQEILSAVEGLGDMRNKTIYAHGYSGISGEGIKEEYQRIKKSLYENSYVEKYSREQLKKISHDDYLNKIEKPSRRDVITDIKYLIKGIGEDVNEFERLNDYIIKKLGVLE